MASFIIQYDFLHNNNHSKGIHVIKTITLFYFEKEVIFIDTFDFSYLFQNSSNEYHTMFSLSRAKL